MIKSKFTTVASKILILGILIQNVPLFSLAPTNFYRPYDINFKTVDVRDKDWKVGVNFEYGSTSKGRDWDENKANVLRLANPTQSSIAMLAGFKKDSEPWKLLNGLPFKYSPTADDGVRGYFKFSGDFEETDFTVCGRYRLPLNSLPGKFDFYAYLPFKDMKISNVKKEDQTKAIVDADFYVQDNITKKLDELVKTYGNLDLGNWSSFGVSDLAFILNWFDDFKQDKEYLKNVRLHAHVGLTVPTGKEKNEDKAFSLPLGNDGAWGIPFGLGIDLGFVNHLKSGLELEILALLDDTKTRRLKTHEKQTDFLFLQKGEATKSFGLTWKFNLYLQSFHFYRGLSAKAVYQFIKHDDDRVTAKSDDFVYSIINSAQSLKEWTSHNLILQLNYDFFKEAKNFVVKPQLCLFYKMPLTGRQVISPYTFGAQVSCIF